MKKSPPSGTCCVCPAEFLAALSGDAASQTRIYHRSIRRLNYLAHRHAPDLPPDLYEDITQETWQLILARGVTPYTKAAVEPDAYMSQVLRNGVEVVRSDYRSAGSQSRSRLSSVGAAAGDELTAGIDTAESERLFEREERARDIRLHFDWISAKAEPKVGTALSLIVTDGLTINEAAQKVGLSRQTFSRRLLAFQMAA